MLEPDWERVSRCGGYIAVYCPQHPRAWTTGYVHLHILVAEYKLGRFLLLGEIVHHKDHDKFFNHPDNLEIVSGHSEHARIHSKDHPQTFLDLTCDECGIVFKRRLGQESAKKGGKGNFCSRSCNGRYQRRRQLTP